MFALPASSRKYFVLLVVLTSAIYTIHLVLEGHHGYIPSGFFGDVDTPFLEEELATIPPARVYHAGVAPVGKENATLVFLARNSDLDEVKTSVERMERRYNNHNRYPWVFLNEQPFTEEFMETVSNLTEAKISFGLIPPEHWYQPEWIDEDRAAQGRQKMHEQNIIYAESVPYRNMCRFNSGFFFKHELLQQYKYYWRVEPNVDYFCDLAYDPFTYMRENDKIYGWTISFYEWEPTIPTLWKTTKEFMKEHPEYVHPDNAMRYLSDDGGKTYNLCHFWSNFEIADMDFWRSPAYQAYFAFLESRGGFYYERWGDAPVHSIAVALFAPKTAIHFFRDIGYRHEPFQHCPQGNLYKEGSCSCKRYDNIDYRSNSCTPRFERLFYD
ncbi:glycosyltransferase family 15 protein [Schizophyllum commune H4-8]|uniref:glycosyltransferase family 15 protein n=1 Tax=Schizophyllum commune (strain H4-8 / FGSC 9210) TaxID=578458 RepID=UPI002160BFB4|nr:glycosyltransferase family 15 protein [Schizophyllum commune H4-8]KAI5897365.1 glycosyltransferase family 15 protein [Schizophyllum commune H4-8]